MHTCWSRNLPSRYEQVRTVGSLFVASVPDSVLVNWEAACLHRIGGPAVYCDNDIVKAWCRDGQHHRYDGPAMTNPSNQVWFQEGRRHRIEGPASKWGQGGSEYEYWYLEGAVVRVERPWLRRARRLRFLLPCN